jgi:photosystem II stability/assembly factor-like uncharacterized protein
LVLGGLRGNAYFSPDLGTSWSRIAFGTLASITAFAGGDGERLFAANQAGALFASDDGGRSFVHLPVQGATSLAALVDVGNDVFVLAGLRGVQRVNGRGGKS